jgi:hypothetical protein
METFFKEKQGKRKDKSFSSKTRMLFIYCNQCWECGLNNWDALHHILGGDFDEADSPLNACPIHNFMCHIGGGHHFTEEQTNNYLALTLRHLYYQKYKLDEKDKKFIQKFKSKYEATKMGAEYLAYYNK